MLAYYSIAAAQEFWVEHWGGHSVEELLAIARRSPLTDLITRALPTDGVILEAGCGLGQYVLLLRERGWRVAGVDWSFQALAACRRAASAPLALMELRGLAIADGALAGYISLGGVLIVSVPYVNGVRRLAAGWIRRRNREIARQGGAFYQSAFSRTELVAALARCGFSVRAAHPYDPARILRQALRPLRRRRRRRASASGESAAPTAAAEPRRERTLVALAKRLLYTEPALRLLGHMLLVVARKT